MEKIDYGSMSNAELKLFIETSYNEFVALKAQMLELCKKMEDAQNKYNNANVELNNRKNILI